MQLPTLVDAGLVRGQRLLAVQLLLPLERLAGEGSERHGLLLLRLTLGEAEGAERRRRRRVAGL